MDSEDFGEIKTILYISFNQDGSCFCLGTINGFCIGNVSPLKELHNSGKIVFVYYYLNRF